MPKAHAARVIMHNSISLDGSFIHLEAAPDFMGLHYQIAATFGNTVRLFGSNTAVVSMDMFGGFTPETADDFEKPRKQNEASDWVVIDSKATLKDKLHYFRRSEYCRDISVIVSKGTSPEYVDYLKTRQYQYFECGQDQVDLEEGIAWIASHYRCDSILVDSGSGLTNAMLNAGLVDEISLLILPTIVGGKGENLFGKITCPLKLSLLKQQAFPGGFVWVSYKVDMPT